MKAVVFAAIRYVKDLVLEWLEGPEGRATLIQALRDLADRTDTDLDDRAVEIVVQGLEHIKKF